MSFPFLIVIHSHFKGNLKRKIRNRTSRSCIFTILPILATSFYPVPLKDLCKADNPPSINVPFKRQKNLHILFFSYTNSVFLSLFSGWFHSRSSPYRSVQYGFASAIALISLFNHTLKSTDRHEKKVIWHPNGFRHWLKKQTVLLKIKQEK